MTDLKPPSEYVNFPPNAGVSRKVQWSATAAALLAPIAYQVSYPLAGMIVARVPWFQSDVGFISVAVLIELTISALITGLGAFATGWTVRARAEEVVNVGS